MVAMVGVLHVLNPISVKSKTDKFSKIKNRVNLKNKQHHSEVLLNSFPMNGHTLGPCRYAYILFVA